MKKKQIAFIEMETHSALLEQWYLLVSQIDSIDFHFFVSQKVFEKLTAIPINHITIIASVRATDFSNFDAVVVNTLHRNFSDYADLFQQKKVLCLVHNLNFSLFLKSISWKNIFKEKEKLTYFLKLYLKEKVGSKRNVVHRAKNFGVISASALETIKTDGRYSEKSRLIPMNYCQNSEFPSSDRIQIVMPGNVSNKRKDVDLLFKILPKLQPQSKIHFTFLGKPENDTVLQQLERLKTQCHSNISITHFHKFIPWEEYSKVIAQAHLLLCPIKSKTSFYWVDEYYGSTKVSGAEADCIYNGKIGIFPSSYPKMDWHNLYYEDKNDLKKIIEDLNVEIIKKEYKNLNPYLEKYTFEKVKSELEKLLLNL
ncbi:hypothetical protein EQG63_10320 [Flavobacterium amnicola]|uniref:Glycosyl transferase family 1 domain-containing protein n=1 Tax=Flavobacterium amnicola TaxID=2506422 RepID=A0A4Q1K2M2_9FLAO|nr:hypothetical protein [Flavobacterium amnicola]RXR17868.1 hypothetical protein EQG63_10320 [Flavobacterium amnicola]